MKYILYSILLVTLNAHSQMANSSNALENDNLELFKKISNPENYQTSFFESVDAGAIEISTFLLSKGVEINDDDKNGSTALINAVTAGDSDMVQLLMDNGADPNKSKNSGLKGTALMYAGYSNKADIVNSLIKRGANLNVVDINNDPAINWASYYGSTVAMRILVEQGADLKIRSKHGLSVDVVYRLWHADSVAAIFRESSIANSLGKNQQILVEAVRQGEYSKVEKQLKKGVSANTLDELAIPVLHSVAEQGDLKLFKLLHKNGADLSKLNRVGQSAMAVAARFGQSEIVDYMIKNGVDPNLAGDEYQLTPIIGGAINGSSEIGKLLLSAGADPNATDVVNKASALNWSLFYKNEDFAMAILNSGLYPNKSSQETMDPLELAKYYGLNRVVNKLNELQNPLLGSWLMSQIHYIYADTTYIAEMSVAGRFIVTPESYAIMYNPYGSERKSPVDMSKMTDKEKLYSFQTTVFNSGKYVISDSTFTTTADIAKVAGFEGGIQYYKISKEKDGMSITMFDETYPSGKKPEWFGSLEIKFILRKEE